MPRALSTHPDAVRSRLRRQRAASSAAATAADSSSRRSSLPTTPPRLTERVASTFGLKLTRGPRLTNSPDPPRLATPWRSDPCPHCGCLLLAAEKLDWCCRNGERLLEPLPPLPPRIQQAVVDHPYQISDNSRMLNSQFCLSAMGVDGSWSKYTGGSGYWLAVTGRTYHRIFPTDRPDHPAHWFLHDPLGAEATAARQSLPRGILASVRSDIQSVNPLYQIYRGFRDYEPNAPEAYIALPDVPNLTEIGAMYHTGNAPQPGNRTIYTQRKADSVPTRIPITHRLYEPLQYPLLFPHGTPGWGRAMVPKWTQINYYKARLLTESRFHDFRRLACEYICDMYSRVEDERLEFIKKGVSNQARIFDSGILDDDGTEEDTNNFHLPASFTGSPKYYSNRVADALALARQLGKPDLMITATTNPNWPELKSMLRPGQSAVEAPQITNRVFKARLALLLKEIKAYFGVLYHVYVIEFQKRGLPHAHIVIKLRKSLRIEDIDSIISAKMPERPGRLRDLVSTHMMHSEDHLSRQYSRCEKNGECIYHYPHAPVPYTQLNARQRVDYQRGSADAWVVPYSPRLLLLWEGHINVEAIFTVDVFLYIYKYLFKGPDHGNFKFSGGDKDEPDHFDDYIRARYISTPEACWRIFAFNISHQHPSTVCLDVHEPGLNRPQYRVGNGPAASESSNLKRYFIRPRGVLFDNLLYTSYFTDFIHEPPPDGGPDSVSYDWWLESEELANVPPHIVHRRSRGLKVARLQTVRPGHGEVFYIRMLLFHHPARSFEDLRTIDGALHPSFQEAARAAGLFAEENEGLLAMEDAVASMRSPKQLRFLFVMLVVEGSPALDIWDRFKCDLSRDFLRDCPQPPAPELLQLSLDNALRDLDLMFSERGSSNADFGLPSPATLSSETMEELKYFAPKSHELREFASASVLTMNDEQKTLYDALHAAIYTASDNAPRLHFITGKAGRGKSFVVDATVAYARSHSLLAVVVGTTALSVSGIDRGRTAHSVFALPVSNNSEDAVISRITAKSARAAYLRDAKFIVWDELPMANVAVVEAVDTVLRAVMHNDSPFGGKLLIGIGDFRQVAPVVRGGGPTACLMASILSSPVWRSFVTHTLAHPIRNASDPAFADFVDHIGEDTSGSRIALDPFLRRISDLNDVVASLFNL